LFSEKAGPSHRKRSLSQKIEKGGRDYKEIAHDGGEGVPGGGKLPFAKISWEGERLTKARKRQLMPAGKKEE